MKHFTLRNFCILAILACSCYAFTGIRRNNRPAFVKADTSLKVYKDPQITAFFKRETGWIAADGAYSFPIGNGKVIWTFGDSFTNDYDPATGTVPCLFNVRSCMMLQPLNNWDWHQTETILSPQKGTLFHSDTTANHFNWPAAGFQVKDTAYVFCFNMKNVPGGLGFGFGGNDAFAKVKLPEMTVSGYHTLQDFNGIEFGLGFVKNTDGYVYAYGCKAGKTGKNNAYVARFKMSNPNSKWAFWDGTGWNMDIKKAASIGVSGYGGISVSKVKNKYLMLTSQFSVGCDQGKNIYAQVSNNPTGPFTAPKTLYTLDDTVKGHYPFFYLATAHPEYINNKNELLITYSINGYGDCVPACVNNRYNPDFYRPRGIRVPLKFIDPSFN